MRHYLPQHFVRRDHQRMCGQMRGRILRPALRQQEMRELLPDWVVGRARHQRLREHSCPYFFIDLECKTSTINATGGYYRYADNYTRTCVFPWQCSLGYFADNLTQSCVPQCPSSPTPAYSTNASVGYINSVCQITCQSPYFADYVAGLCVLDCITNNTYADASSTRTCVTACNSSGLTPWADNTTWTCVSGTSTLI